MCKYARVGNKLFVILIGRLGELSRKEVEVGNLGGSNLPGDYEQRRTGRKQGGEYACFEFGNTSHFRGAAKFASLYR